MFIRYSDLLLGILLICCSKASAQTRLLEYMVSDSLVKSHKIKQATEHWFSYSTLETPSSTTIENYSETGLRTKRKHIDYPYHRFISTYAYDMKKGVVKETLYQYDWKKGKKSKRDTTIKRSVTKYDLVTHYNIKSKPSRLNNFKTIFKYDVAGKLTEQTDTIKWGYHHTYFSYDENGFLADTRRYREHLAYGLELYNSDSLFYNASGMLIKEVNIRYTTCKANEAVPVSKKITTYRYNALGLIEQKIVLHKNLPFDDSIERPFIYNYVYEFY